MSKVNWMVYLLECRDGSLYCGATDNIERRIVAHGRGQGSKYVRSRLPFRLIETTNLMTKSQALKLEAAIKKLPKAKKKTAECWI